MCDQCSFHFQNIQSSLQSHQTRVDDLQRDMMTVKQIVVRSRPGLARTHPDVQRLERDVDNLTNRWESLRVQIADRLVTTEETLTILFIEIDSKIYGRQAVPNELILA